MLLSAISTFYVIVIFSQLLARIACTLGGILCKNNRVQHIGHVVGMSVSRY